MNVHAVEIPPMNATSPDVPVILSASEVADLLYVDRKTVYLAAHTETSRTVDSVGSCSSSRPPC